MRSHYYKILGLPDNSSENDVRKRYRKLVMQYHPDKNPSKEAEIKFIAIKDAYEVLTGKKAASTNVNNATSRSRRSSAPKGTTEQQATEFKKRATEAKQRLHNQKLHEYIENERYFRRLTSGYRWQLMKVSAIIGVLLASFMVADLMLPRHYTEDEVTRYNINTANGISGSRVSLIETKESGYYWLDGLNYSAYAGNHKVWIESSWILHNPVRILAQDKVRMFGFQVNFNFFRLSFLIIPLFLLPAFTYWYKRRKISFTVLHQFCTYGVNGLMLYFLISGDRWAHIFSLGFL